jgi:hypothetical protein
VRYTSKYKFQVNRYFDCWTYESMSL